MTSERDRKIADAVIDALRREVSVSLLNGGYESDGFNTAVSAINRALVAIDIDAIIASVPTKEPHSWYVELAFEGGGAKFGWFKDEQKAINETQSLKRKFERAVILKPLYE